jgi:hypothetical protein
MIEQELKVVENTVRLFDRPRMLYSGPCNHCGHDCAEDHIFLYCILNGLTFHDRFRCRKRGCLCGASFALAYEKGRHKLKDMGRLDSEANTLNKEVAS